LKLRPIETIKYLPVRFAEGCIFYFDGEKIVKEPYETAYQNCPEVTYTRDVRDNGNVRITIDGPFTRYFSNGKECFESHSMSIWENYGRCYYEDGSFFQYEAGDEKFNGLLFAHFRTLIREGDTYEDMKKKLETAIWKYFDSESRKKVHKTESYKSWYETSIDRFITKIESPIFVREPENQDKDTFDFIKMYANIISDWPDKRKYIIANKKYIFQMVLDKLSTNKSFLRFGVPIGCLACTSLMEREDATLEFIFEIKKELREVLEDD
jgi:hypothetical protein